MLFLPTQESICPPVKGVLPDIFGSSKKPCKSEKMFNLIETGVLHVLIGTYDLLPFCNLDGQMARRGSEFHFARYHMEDENDCQAFRNAFSSLLKQIPLQVDHDTLIQRWWYFFEGSIGCIGTLKQWLVRSLYRALREESPELTPAHLEQVLLPDAQLDPIPADVSKWGS